MNRGAFLVAASCALAASQPAGTLAKVRRRIVDPDQGRWGAALGAADSTGVLPALSPRALYGTAIAGTPLAPDGARAVVLPNLPSIATQGVDGHAGSPGSCEAQSFGYCLGAYTAARNPDGSRKWSAADPANQPSAAWLYQWEHDAIEHDKRVCPAGSGAKPYLDRLVSDGAPSAAQVPYDPHDAPTVAAECAYIKGLNVAGTWPGESRLTIASYKIYPNVLDGKATYLAQFKDLVRHGHAIAFTGLVAKGYGVDSPVLTDGVFTAPQGFIPSSGHGQVIVGFDDAKGPNGAFLVQNSFGPDWNAGPASDHGRNGRIWWDYDAFFASQKYCAIAFSAGPASLAAHPGATTLTSNDPGAPHFTVANAVLRDEANGNRLLLVTHASDAVRITGLRARDPAGRAVAASLNESMRLGYQHLALHGGARLAPGPYDISYTARTRAGRSVVYHGTVQVGAHGGAPRRRKRQRPAS
ncbi:MAG TPA: hypothetical protein VGC96_13020 [Candidatus Elarobacter sp.]|jgi:hypothetical protein